MKQALLAVGGCSGWAAAASDDYLRRLRRWGGVEVIAVRPEPSRGDVEAVKAAEGRRLLERVGPRDRLVVLDERGVAPTTDTFRDLVVEGLGAEGRLIWAIGGAFGHPEEVRRRAWRVVRLSSLVLNHDLARVVLVEQLYRAHTLLHNVPYHH